MNRGNYTEKILKNILVIICVAFVIWYVFYDDIVSVQHGINRRIYRNMLSKGEIVYQDAYEGANYRYEDVLMKYEDQYVYFQVDYPVFWRFRSVVLLQFDDGLCAVPIVQSPTDGYQKVAVISQNKDIETIKMIRYTEAGIKIPDDFEMVRQEGTDIFVGEYDIGIQNSIGYLENYTVEGYDKDGNLIAVNKCANQVRHETGFYK